MRSPSAALLAAALLAGASSGCHRESEPKPVPAAAAQTAEPALTPLTSRQADGSAPAGAGAPADHGAAPAGTLPPGHPPLDASAGAPGPGAIDGPAITGTVDVSPALKGQIEGGALFLIARNAKKEIVAVRREPSEA